MARVKKLVLPAIFLAAVYYAVFGGQYSIFALRRARAEAREERVTLARLQHQLDSLKAWADSIRTDPATLERLARERYGMIKKGETLYRFVRPDDSTKTAADTAHLPPH